MLGLILSATLNWKDVIMVWSNQAPTYLIFPPGATSGERLVIDESGIKAYDANGNLYVDIDANNPLNFAITMPPGYNPSGQRLTITPAGINAYNSTNDNILQIETGVSGQLGAQILNLLNANGTHTSASIEGGTYVTDGAGLTVLGGGGIIVLGTSGDTIQFGSNGLPGGYYWENIAFNPTEVFTNNAYVKGSNFSSKKIISDYGSAWNLTTGTWTCPAASTYQCVIQSVFNYSGTSSTRCGILVERNAVSTYYQDTVSVNGNISLVLDDYFNQGDILTVWLFQNSGASHGNSGFITIKRNL